jgi:hypothetical protein
LLNLDGDDDTPNRAGESPRGVTGPSSTIPAWAASTQVPLPPGFLESDVVAPATGETNTPPVLRAPTIFEVARQGATLIEGMSTEDTEATRDGGEIGVLLYTAHGTMEFGSTDGVTLHAPNGSQWIPIIGTIDAVNTTLATLHYTPGRRGPHTLEAIVSDFGHGGRFPTMVDPRFVSLRLV